MTRPPPRSHSLYDFKISRPSLVRAIPPIATMRLDTTTIMLNRVGKEKPYNVSIIGFTGFISFYL